MTPLSLRFLIYPLIYPSNQAPTAAPANIATGPPGFQRADAPQRRDRPLTMMEPGRVRDRPSSQADQAQSWTAIDHGEASALLAAGVGGAANG